MRKSRLGSSSGSRDAMVPIASGCVRRARSRSAATVPPSGACSSSATSGCAPPSLRQVLMARSTSGPDVPTSSDICTRRRAFSRPPTPSGPRPAWPTSPGTAASGGSRPGSGSARFHSLSRLCTCSRKALSAAGRVASWPASACAESLVSIRTRPWEIVWPLASAAAFTRSMTASTAMPCVASDTKALRRAASPPIVTRRRSVSGFSALMSRAVRRAQRLGFRAGGALELAGDLQQVADDHLVVGLGPLVGGRSRRRCAPARRARRPLQAQCRLRPRHRALHDRRPAPRAPVPPRARRCGMTRRHRPSCDRCRRRS